MKNKMLMKTTAFLLVFAGLTAAAFGQITISGGFALSQMDSSSSELQDLEAGIGIGGNVYLDYLLPINIPLSLGGEIGLDTASLKGPPGTTIDETIMAIPLLARAAYHFDLMPRLDLYAVGKVGVVFGNWIGKLKDASGNEIEIAPAVSFGFDVGAAYYFTPLLGVFIEAGFDRYNLEAKLKYTQTSYYDSYNGGYDGYSDYDNGYSSSYSTTTDEATLEAPFNRFVTIGISTKF
jgi:hypothetical protein